MYTYITKGDYNKSLRFFHNVYTLVTGIRESVCEREEREKETEWVSEWVNEFYFYVSQ